MLKAKSRRLSRRLSVRNLHPVVSGDDRGPGEADEEAALQGAWDAFDLNLKRRRVQYRVEGAVGGIVAAVRDVRAGGVGPVHPEFRLAAHSGEGFEGSLPTESVDLHRQGIGAQKPHPLF